jgi:hypothetical protein
VQIQSTRTEHRKPLNIGLGGRRFRLECHWGNTRTLDKDGITYLNKLKTIDVWVKAEKKDAELQNTIAEQKLRTQRILGELLADGQRKGEIRKPSDNQHCATAPREIADIGISHKQSSAFQAIASIPEEHFEEFIQEKKKSREQSRS